MTLMNILAQTEHFDLWDKVLAGQTGFALATLVFGFFFWRAMLPRWDRQTAAIERLADGLALLVTQHGQHSGHAPEQILNRIEELRGHQKAK